MSNDSARLSALLRQDLTAFIIRTLETVDGREPYLSSWHIELIADRLMAAYRGEIKRLIITLPPRSLKSICASVAFPAWALGQNPKLRFICASYSQDLAGKLARDCRKVMAAAWYRNSFPCSGLNPAKSAEEEFETLAGGYRLSTSVEGSLTGRGGNFIIIDDPIKPLEARSDRLRQKVNEWYDSTLYSRLDSKEDDVIIIIMQRVHVDDLVAHVTEKEDWDVLRLPAIAECDERFRLLKPLSPRYTHVSRREGQPLHEARESLQSLSDIRRTLGSPLFSAQYQQQPIPLEGSIIKRRWLQYYDEDISKPDQIVQSWDVAATAADRSNWSVCTTWHVKKKKYYLKDVVRERLEFPDLKRKVKALARAHNANVVLIENAHVGIGLIQQLKTDGDVRVISVQPNGSKVDRMTAQSALFEAGAILLPRVASWKDAYVDELLAFPGGRNDDQVDSTSQFLNWIESRGRARVGVLF